jgi:DhnA family fructose-bisphosphate aldolase class Ia
MNMLRTQEFFSASDRRSLIVDTSAGMMLGALPGLEDFEGALRPVLPLVDGLVCASGQLRRLEGSTRRDAGLLMRMDWTNSLRGPDFVLPPAKVQQFQLFGVQDASDFGAVGMVITFLLGYEEEIEAACMKTTVTLAIEGKSAGMPLILEVRPSGPRVSLYGKAVELGASYALEGGADVIVVPYPGSASLMTISQMVSVPWLLKPTSVTGAQPELDEALALGCGGLWLDHSLFAKADPLQILQSLHAQLHPVSTPE